MKTRSNIFSPVIRWAFFGLLLGLGTLIPTKTSAQKNPPANQADSLGRKNPRSAVTAFLEACHSDDYQKAAQYLDLRQIPARNRAQQGPALAKQLEAILNSDSHFDVLRLSLAPEGNLSDDANASIEHVTTITRNGQGTPIELERVELQAGSPVWLFTPATVAAIPRLAPTTTESAIEARLPRFLVSITFLETPLWKWIALLAAAIVVVLFFRFFGHLLLFSLRKVGSRFNRPKLWAWMQAILEPLLVFLSVLVFGAIEQLINPAALSRLYISRFLLLVVVCSFAWCLINVVELFLTRIDSLLDPRQRMVSHSLIYLGRRVMRVIIVIIAGIVVLSNWGYDMTTIIAGLGVGGIAFALAAQKTIENVFGGVSVIGDNPIMVGDFGSFGGLLGTVEDIGMRSTRIRTLNRTVVSVPNAAFATMNLENYSLRDKILFNPKLQVKRPVPKEKVYECMAALEHAFSQNKALELGPTPVRLTGLTAAAYAIEIFAYVQTSDVNEYYKLEPGLYMAIDEVMTECGVELA